MTIFDYIVLFLLACSVVIGLVRGFVREILSLASWMIALVIANAYAENLALLLPESIPGNMIRLIVAFLALFILVKLLFGLFSMAVESLVKATGLGVVNRSFGVLFGVARGVVMVLVLVLVCGATAIPQQPFWRNAMLRPFVMDVVSRVIPYLPAEFSRRLTFS